MAFAGSQSLKQYDRDAVLVFSLTIIYLMSTIYHYHYVYHE